MQTSATTPAPTFLELVEAMPREQVVLVIAFFVVVGVAGNAVFVLHHRRVGTPFLKALFDPRSFPLFNFNGREWFLFVCVFIVAFVIGIAAIQAGQRPN
jgi:hypothetical protein